MFGSFIQIGSYIFQIALGRFVRKKSARAEFTVKLPALVFWSRAWVAFRLFPSLSEVQAVKSGMASILGGNGTNL